MRYICLFALMLPSLSAQDGSALYKEHCATCHDAPKGRVPALSAIKAMSGEAIYLSLTTGLMKTQAAGLSTGQVFALIGYVAPTGASAAAPPVFTPTCHGDPAFHPDAGAQWNGWSTDLTNSRYQDAAAAGLPARDVPKLKVKWAFNLGDVTVARSQPTIVGGRVFIGSQTGALYSLDAATGCTWWGFQAATGLRAGVAVGDANGAPAVFFADSGGTMYALHAQTGQLLWKVKPVDHYATLATATPRFYKGVLYQPFSSYEEALAGDPKFQCCTFRGSVVALDAATGKTLWKTFTISEAAKAGPKTPAGAAQMGPSGAAIWSTPTIDEQRAALYVSTGDNYSNPATNTSDAILALDLKTGALLWSRQLTENDAFNNSCAVGPRTNCPASAGEDFDFGQPPILVKLSGTKRALVIAQKSGMVHAIDPDEKGKILWQTRAGAGGVLGGSQWGSASDGEKVYVAISDIAIGGVADPKSPCRRPNALHRYRWNRRAGAHRQRLRRLRPEWQ